MVAFFRNQMNYTRPDEPEHEDEPLDWLGSSLIFARALAYFLDEGQGIIINNNADVKITGCETPQLILYYSNSELLVIETPIEGLPEGTIVMVNNINDKTNLN